MTPTAAQYAREIRRDARDAIFLVSLMRDVVPSASARGVAEFAWRAADRCRNGGIDLPKTEDLKACAQVVHMHGDNRAWLAMLNAAREAHAELDASIDYTRPA